MSISEIIVEFTGPLARVCSVSEISVARTSDCTLGELLAEIARQFPQTEKFLASGGQSSATQAELPSGLLVARDGSLLPPLLSTRVHCGDRLTLMPMISGG